ncbi:MAG: HNH endonuclease [Oscillospiraceae bacterium]|nr:HNH endonuclease [Oscillospiraceae bacterium]
MPNIERKSKARIKQSALLPPNPEPNALVDRDVWIEQASQGFITNSSANKGIYRVILETLWPKGHGIPGPVIDRDSIRRAVDKAKGKPYLDVFRRLRELQGDEGFLGVVKQGNQYQLIDLNVYAKKTPRAQLPDDKWSLVVAHYNNVCAVCGSVPDEKGFQQDHKVPRARGGTDATTNWQPLCDSCNNMKSVACRACKEDCTKCGYAYPEFYKPLKLPGSTLRLLHQYTNERKLDANVLVSDWILERINAK